MKKSQMYKKVNRKKRIFNHVNRNVVYPVMRQFHPIFNPNLDEEGHNNAVEIIELNSNDVSENEQQNNFNHDVYKVYQDNYKVNRTARDKRRHDIENSNPEDFNDSIYDDQCLINQFCTDLYGIDCYDRGERMPGMNNRHSEFFTILNNHKTSDTSSDSNLYDDIEVIQHENTIENDNWNTNKDFYDNRNNISYNNEDKREKRTIWIYALKNKRYMSENDFELINIPSKESTSSTDEEEHSIASPNIRRTATPIPTYIPRMFFPLSPTLPTVTEVTEPNKLISNNSDISAKSTDNTTIFQKPLNGWFHTGTKKQNDIQNLDNEETDDENKCQTLSPRERRRLRQAKTNEQSTYNVNKVPETLSYCEPTIIIRDNELSSKINTDNFEKEIDTIENNDDDEVIRINNKSPDYIDKGIDCTPNESLHNLQKPKIKLSTEIKKLKRDITEPMEKLDGNWIGRSLPKDDELLEVYDYVMNKEDINAQNASERRSGDVIEDSASGRLYIRNVALLKPAEWTEYLPMTGSVPSLHLSISVDTDLNYEKKSWFKRFLQFVRCCK